VVDTPEREDRLRGTRFAGELRRQLEAVAAHAGVRERRHRRRRRFIFIAATIIGAGAALAGAALAGAFDSGTPAPWPEPPLPAESVYPTNAAGQTYGGDKPLVESPDLVAAVGVGGKHGYLRKADVFPDAPTTNPEEAAEETKRSLRGYTIPLYESDGVTQVGVFQMGGPGSEAAGGSRDGDKWRMFATQNGDIVTETTHPDGSMTIETEALDGTVTTRELTAAEAERLRAETATPKSTVTPTPEPVRPAPWLLERMSQLAREAGDPRASAWWELQSRYYLEPIEGDRPESPYEQWATVWLVVLHGDFPGADWRYWLLDKDSHNVLASGESDEKFTMSGPQLPPPEGPVKLGE
jgi:hypothetical protein